MYDSLKKLLGIDDDKEIENPEVLEKKRIKVDPATIIKEMENKDVASDKEAEQYFKEEKEEESPDMEYLREFLNKKRMEKNNEVEPGNALENNENDRELSRILQERKEALRRFKQTGRFR